MFINQLRVFLQCLSKQIKLKIYYSSCKVPTVAIENVWISVNTSIIQDEVLAHRVGLIPISCDPSKLDDLIGEDETDRDTIVFHFDVECTDVEETSVKGKKHYHNDTAYSSSLKWLSQGNQLEVFPGAYTFEFDNAFRFTSITLLNVTYLDL